MDLYHYKHLFNPLVPGSKKTAYKVWSHNREIRRGFIASSLDELIEMSRAKLGLKKWETHQLRLVLESDGTQISEEAYFETLPSDSILLLLTPVDKWVPDAIVREADHHLRDLLTILGHALSSPSALKPTENSMMVELEMITREIKKLLHGPNSAATSSSADQNN